MERYRILERIMVRKLQNVLWVSGLHDKIETEGHNN